MNFEPEDQGGFDRFEDAHETHVDTSNLNIDDHAVAEVASDAVAAGIIVRSNIDAALEERREDEAGRAISNSSADVPPHQDPIILSPDDGVRDDEAEDESTGPPLAVHSADVQVTQVGGRNVEVIEIQDTPAEDTAPAVSESDSRKRSLDNRGDAEGGDSQDNQSATDEDRNKQQKTSTGSATATAQNTRHSCRWNDMFQKLVIYKDQYGDCLVPNRFSADPPLGHWVSSQRRQYKALQSGQAGANAMNKERIAQLEEIGFEWETSDPRHVPWEVRYRELKDYVERFGDAQVPMRWKENIQLSNWVSKQRHDYKLRQRGTSGRLTDERYKLLNDVGFIWEAGKDYRDARPPSPLPPHRPPQAIEGGRSTSSGRGRRTSHDSGRAGSENDIPPSNFARQPGAQAAHNPNNLHPMSKELQAGLATHVRVNPRSLMQAANMNSMKLQLAGLFPAGTVGSQRPHAPGGLLTISVAGSQGLSFLPILHNGGNPLMPQPGMPPHPGQAPQFNPHMHGHPQGGSFPPGGGIPQMMGPGVVPPAQHPRGPPPQGRAPQGHGHAPPHGPDGAPAFHHGRAGPAMPTRMPQYLNVVAPQMRSSPETEPPRQFREDPPEG